MEIKEKLETFKSTLTSIEMYLKLTDEDLNYSLEVGRSNNTTYYRIIQRSKNDSISYYIEYMQSFDIVRLDVSFYNKNSKKLTHILKENMIYKGKVSTEKTKYMITYSFYYKFEDISLLSSLALVMIEVLKSNK